MAMNWDYIKKNRNSFYNKPQMAGHYWAKDILDLANSVVKNPKLNKTKIQKFIIANSFKFDKQVDWHYFINVIDKKYIAQVKHALRKVNASNVASELKWIQTRSGVLRSDLDRALSVLAFKLQPNKYVASQIGAYTFLGMDQKNAMKRARDVVKLMEKKLRVKWR